MKRRAFIGVAWGLLAWRAVAHAGERDRPVVGFLSARSPREAAVHVAAFRRGLRDAGYVEGRNVVIEYRWAHGRYDRLPSLAAELVALQVDLLVTVGGTAPALAAKHATAIIPIVFVNGDDPVAAGLVASFNRPGGNATGVNFLTAELGGKRLALLCELVPHASRIAFLVNPSNPNAIRQIDDVEAAARALGRRLLVQRASADTDFPSAFVALTSERVDAMVIANEASFDSRRDEIVALAARHSLPAIYHISEFPAAGGLMSYGASLADAYGQAGAYAGRILGGEAPREMPVLQSTKFELVINRRTAKALGLTVPQSLLLRADEVIG